MAGPWALTFKNLFFPIFCQICRRRLLTDENGYFCPDCWEMSRQIEPPYCTICGTPHTGRSGFGAVQNFPCAECRAAKTRPFGRIYGAAYYEGAVAEAIKLFKFNGKIRLAGPLAERMIAFAGLEIPHKDYDTIVAVPLHPVRRRERGYNQSELLADAITSAFPHAQRCDALARIRPTHVQSRLKDAKARAANVAGAFAVRRGFDVAGKRVLLIDDVVTTGATVAECARALVSAGAARVDVFATSLRASAADVKAA